MIDRSTLTIVRNAIRLGLTDEQIIGLVGTVTVFPATPEPTSTPAPVEVPRKRHGAVTYSAIVTAARLANVRMTPQQREVAAYILANPGKTSAEIATATGIGAKAVQSPIYQLRAMNPRIIRSSND